jgi:hypothetical protein
VLSVGGRSTLQSKPLPKKQLRRFLKIVGKRNMRGTLQVQLCCIAAIAHGELTNASLDQADHMAPEAAIIPDKSYCHPFTTWLPVPPFTFVEPLILCL